MNKNELKSELAKKYYSEDANCLSDFIDILDEFEKLTSYNSDYEKCVRCNKNNRSRLCEKCIDEIRQFA